MTASPAAPTLTDALHVFLTHLDTALTTVPVLHLDRINRNQGAVTVNLGPAITRALATLQADRPDLAGQLNVHQHLVITGLTADPEHPDPTVSYMVEEPVCPTGVPVTTDWLAGDPAATRPALTAIQAAMVWLHHSAHRLPAAMDDLDAVAAALNRKATARRMPATYTVTNPAARELAITTPNATVPFTA